jgi:hypothetical protein
LNNWSDERRGKEEKMVIKKAWGGVSVMTILATVIVSCGPSATPTPVPPTALPTQAAVTSTVQPTDTPAPTPKPIVTPAATYTDPFAYCAAVGDMDKPDARYVGQQVPEVIAKALREASGAAPDAPLDMFITNSYWRCMGGKAYGCFVGANIPCWSKANTDRTPTMATTDFCKTQPDADNIPAAVVGHETIYEWHCKNGTPEIVRQVFKVDARGFITEFWYELSPAN